MATPKEPPIRFEFFADQSAFTFSKLDSDSCSSSISLNKNYCRKILLWKFEKKNPIFASRESNRVGHDEAASVQLIFQIGPKKHWKDLVKGKN